MGYLIHDVIEIVFIYSHSSSKPVKSMTKDTHIFGIVDGRKSMEQNSQYREYLLIQINNTFGRVVYTYTNHLKKVNPLEKNLKIIKYSLIVLSSFSTEGFLCAIITNEKYLYISGWLFFNSIIRF